jgi:hypothetical protein
MSSNSITHVVTLISVKNLVVASDDLLTWDILTGVMGDDQWYELNTVIEQRAGDVVDVVDVEDVVHKKE